MNEQDAITIIPARQCHGADLAIIDNMASHGLSLAFWQDAVRRGEGEDALSLARKRFMDKENIFGWSNALIALEGEEVLGAVTMYEMPPVDDEVEAMKRDFPSFVPVFELFNQAVGDWFVDNMGVFAEHRGKHISSRLLDAGLSRGVERGYKRASLIVESDNLPAMRLYENCGFETVSRREFLDKNGVVDGKYWLFLKQSIG